MLRKDLVRKALFALGLVLIVQCLFALCMVSALQLLEPRNMPFGVTGASPVVNAVTSKVSLHTLSYPDEAAASAAIDQSKLYGAYIPGTTSDTLIVVPAKSFFGQVELEAAFGEAAKKLGRPLTVQNAKPLPAGDPLGGVPGLLLIPILIGGFVAAVFVQKATKTAVAHWRVSMLAGFAVVTATITDLIAGPGIGAYANSHFWPLLPCLIFVSLTVSLAGAALQRLVGPLGTVLVVILFIIVGGASAGGLGVSLLPDYWQHIGAIFPPRHAVELFRNVIYFGGNNILTPCIILGVYAVVGAAVVILLSWWQPGGFVRTGRAPAPATRATAPGTPTAAVPGASEPAATTGATPGTTASDARRAAPAGWSPLVKAALALTVAALVQFLFAANYISSGHAPKATDLPIGVTGSSPLLTAAQGTMSLKAKSYSDQAAAQTAIDGAKVYGAFIPGTTSNTLLVVPSLSDIAPLDLAAHFEEAAKKTGLPLTVQQYTPHPLAPKDPFALVISLMILPVLIGGYMSSTMLRTVSGTAAKQWRGALLVGFAILSGLVLDLIVTYWLQGIPAHKFWIVWPILALVIAGVACVAAVLQTLLGSLGTLVTTTAIVLFGNPSSGGANGVPYLPGFWRAIGPYLPPRNAYILIRNTVYFDGHGTTQSLVVLLLYLLIPLAALGFLNWFRTPDMAVTPATAAEAAAVAVPVTGLP